MHLRRQLGGGVIHLIGIDTGKRIGELTLRIRGRTSADFQRGIGLQKRNRSGNRVRDGPHNLPCHLSYGRAL